MNFLTVLIIILAVALAVLIASAVFVHIMAPVRLTLPDNDEAGAAEWPAQPWAALRSQAESLANVAPRIIAPGGALVWDGKCWAPVSSGIASAGQQADGRSVSGANVRHLRIVDGGFSLLCCYCREGYHRERRLFEPQFSHALPNGQRIQCEVAA